MGDLLRAILTGGPYPATLLNGVTLRIRAEREVTRGRAAILKAYYLRNYPTELNKEVFTVSLNESSNVPYVLGRLFSVLETIQSVANPGINATKAGRVMLSRSAWSCRFLANCPKLLCRKNRTESRAALGEMPST